MKNWKTEKLGELVKAGGGRIQTGPFGSQLHATDYVREGIPCIMPTNMSNNRVKIDEIARISEYDAQRLKRHIVHTGDIVYSRRGDVTQKALIHDSENGYFCGTGCLLLRPGKKIDPAFLTYYLSTKTYQNWIMSQSVGGTMPNLNTGILERISFKAPEPEDQKRIAAVLSALDAKIALNHRINSELEEMAKLLYDFWFVQYDFPLSAAQASALGKPHLTGKPYRTSGGPMVYHPQLKREIPKGWEVGSLLDIATFTNGIACQKFPPTSGEHLRVIKIKEMHAGFTETSEKVTTEIPEKVIVRDGDILFSWSASLEVMIWTGGTGALNQHIFKVTSDDYPRSICYFTLQGCLQHFKMMAELRKTTMGHITREHLEQSLIAIPPKEIGNEFESATQPIFAHIINNHQQNQELTTLRDWLLPMLMNGQVTVK